MCDIEFRRPEALVAAGDNCYGDREVNEAHIRRSLRRAKLVVLGFGDLAAELKALRPDVARLRTIIEQERAAGHTIALHALRITASGAPWHPAALGCAHADPVSVLAGVAALNPI